MQEITSLRSSSYGSVNHIGVPRRSAVAEAGQGRHSLRPQSIVSDAFAR